MCNSLTPVMTYVSYNISEYVLCYNVNLDHVSDIVWYSGFTLQVGFISNIYTIKLA